MIPWESMALWVITAVENPNVMQFTGLKDKNGKEIYEGDILSEVCDMHGSFEVYWDGIGWNAQDKGLTACVFRPGVVIGNIYENPALLSNT